MANLPPDEPNRTMLRPRPGRRPGATSMGANVPPAGSPRTGLRGSAGHAARVAEFATGPNPILSAAVPLLVLSCRLRDQISNADVASLRTQCIQEVRAFDERARKAGAPADDVIAARYALCTAVDEAVLATPWGAQSFYAGESLLVTFHKEREGGKKFFAILEQLLADASRHRDALELFYVCLALGFEGEYALDPRGPARVNDIREDLYRRLESLSGRPEPELSPNWQGVEDRRNAVMLLVPLWVVAAACLVLLVGGFIYFNERLNARAAELNATLADIGQESFVTAPPPPPATVPPPATLPTPATLPPPAAVPPSGLAQFLAPQIQQGLVKVVEQGDRTFITLTVPDLFASGSPRVNPQYDALVHQIGAALNSVPGRILIVGHTDDQPVRSLQFSDNYALSRARASNVALLIGHDVADPGRIASAGKGDSEPLYQPANAPDNRPKNRRVEIISNRAG